MPAQNNKERRVIGSVQRALDILGLFNAQSKELGITEIAKSLSLHKSTASGLVYTLESNGYLEQNPDNRKYHLGLKLLERASTLLAQIEIRQIAGPYLQLLHDWSQESINLAIRDYAEVVYIERVLGEQTLGLRAKVGKRASVHCTALGKAMLAYLPSDEARTILSSYDLVMLTPKTLTEVDAVMYDLDRTRERGFAIDDEENELGGRCVSAPIFNHLGEPIAAISISVPLPRIPPERVPHFGNKVKEVAAQISERMGYTLK
jgi:IclR family transcriptional regulator, KDG regulon repressor